MSADKLWLCVDPGETTGYSIWDAKGELLWADQMPMWKFADAVYAWASGSDGLTLLGAPVEVDDAGLGAVVCEEWQLYPWIIQAGGLDFDKCRTARLIGAITFVCRIYGIEIVFQGADIKPAAEEAGAKNLYLEPVHENRHANDSIQHGVFYKAVHGGTPV